MLIVFVILCFPRFPTARTDETPCTPKPSAALIRASSQIAVVNGVAGDEPRTRAIGTTPGEERLYAESRRTRTYLPCNSQVLSCVFPRDSSTKFPRSVEGEITQNVQRFKSIRPRLRYVPRRSARRCLRQRSLQAVQR